MYGNFSESSLEAAAALFDFTRCVRADGSVYGTSGKCRKGSEIGAKEAPPKTTRAKVAALSKHEKIAIKVMADKSLRSERKRIAEMIRLGVPADTDFISLVGEAKKKIGLKATETIRGSAKKEKASSTAKPDKPKQSLAERMAAAAERLEKQQPSIPKTKSNPTPKVEPKPKVGISPPAEPKKPKVVSLGRLEKSFEKLTEKLRKLEERQDALRSQGKSWDDPEYKTLGKRISALIQGATTLKQAYHAVDKTTFLREAASEAKLLAKAERKSEEANKLLKKDKINIFDIPEKHPSTRLYSEAHELRRKASVFKESKEAAFYGEPVKISKPKSDGGGEVSSSVPSTLPKGGADKDLKGFLDGAEVVMAFKPKGFSGFVKSGEAKNGFQPGTGGVKAGRARPYLEARARGEEKVLSLPQNTKGEDRPVYAALEHPDRSRSLQGGIGMMSQYGGIQVVFKPSVKDRSTFTLGDSLDDNAPRSVPASPVRDPANPRRIQGENRTVNVDYGGGVFSARVRTNVPAFDPKDRTMGIPYVEAQVFGGLRTSDIREVRVYKGHEIPSTTRKMLDKMGVTVVELPPRLRDLVVDIFNPDSQKIDSIVIEK